MLSALFSSPSTNLCWCMFYFTANSLALPILQYPDIRSQPGPSGIQIFNPGIFGTGFCQIPGSRDFSGRDLPLFSIPGLLGNFSGIFRDFCFYFVCWSNHIIFTNLYHYHCHHHYGMRPFYL